MIEYYLLRKTREAHTGNTIIRSYNGDGTMWGPGEQAGKRTKGEQTCGGKDGKKGNITVRERSERDVQLSETKNI
jgi:hypothetical protein